MLGIWGGPGLMVADSHSKFWILDPIYNSMGWFLSQVYGWIPSFGVAIITLTMVMSLVRAPLVAKQVRNQREMQKVQPEVKRIQAKYKSDPQKRNEAMMRVYREHNVNPLAGCLPMLLQMPLFIALYRLIIDLNAKPDPKHLPRTSELFVRLQETGGAMKSFGMDLAEQASQVQGLASRLPYFFLIALVVGTGFFQQRQMMRRMPENSATQQMKVVGKVLPVVFGVFSYNIPAGVVLYFIVSNTFQIGQQAWLYRDHQADQPPPKSKALPKKSSSEGDDADPDVTPAPKPKPKPARSTGSGSSSSRSGGGGQKPRSNPSSGSKAGSKAAGSKAGSKGSTNRSSSRPTTNRAQKSGAQRRKPPPSRRPAPKQGLLARLLGTGGTNRGSTARKPPPRRPGGRPTQKGSTSRGSSGQRKGGRGGPRRDT